MSPVCGIPEPRFLIVHTSPHEIGQIYIPQVNWSMMLATMALVIGFGSSSNLAAAYGVALWHASRQPGHEILAIREVTP